MPTFAAAAFLAMNTAVFKVVFNVLQSLTAVSRINDKAIRLLEPGAGLRAALQQHQRLASTSAAAVIQVRATENVIAATVPALGICTHETAVEQASLQLLKLVQHQSQAHAATSPAADQQLQDALIALQAHSTSISWQQLHPLLAAAGQMPCPPQQLLSVLTSSLVESLPQLTPRALAQALTDLHEVSVKAEAAAKTTQAEQQQYQQPQHQHQHDAQKREQQQQQQVAKQVLLAAVNNYCRGLLTQSQDSRADAPSDFGPGPETIAALSKALSLPHFQRHSTFTLMAMLAVEHVQDMTSQQLVDLLSSFSAAQHWNQAIADAVVQQAVQILQQQQYQLVQHTADWQHQQQQEASTMAPQAGFSPDQLVLLLTCCSQLRHHDAVLLEAAVQATLRSMDRMNLQQVVAIAHACALLNHYSITLFQEGCRQAQQAALQAEQQPGSGPQPQQSSTTSSSPDCSSSSSTNNSPNPCGMMCPDAVGSQGQLAAVVDLAWSCAVLGHIDVQFMHTLAAVLRQVPSSQLNQHRLQQCFEINSFLTDAAVHHPELRTCTIMANNLLVAAQAAWLQKVPAKLTSRFQREVHQALQAVGKKCRVNLSLDGLFTVDIDLRMQHRSKVALQLEGPLAFAANPPYAALGPTAAKWRALQTRGWQVLVVRYSDWQRLRSDEERCEYAWHIKETAASRAPGLVHEVVDVTSRAAAVKGAATHSKQGPSLSKQLWKLLVE